MFPTMLLPQVGIKTLSLEPGIYETQTDEVSQSGSFLFSRQECLTLVSSAGYV